MAAADSSIFRTRAPEFRLTWPDDPGDVAFRPAQLGGLLSLAGHFQTSVEPAQAVLPTGVGKTALICGLPFLVRARRVLVVVPTRLLRDQIHDEFAGLGILRRLGALEFVDNPRVTRVNHRLATRAEWEALSDFEVVVGLPQVLGADYEGVAEPPQGLFDLLIFDEAHHLPAKTWTGLLRQHNQPAALLTATPFRRDRKALPGTLAYNYSLRQAIADGVYSPIEFVPVDAREDDDLAIARVAADRLRDPVHVAEGSMLLVRSDRIEHASDLVGAYRQVGVELDIITSRHSTRHVRGVLKRLRAGELQGVASVGALVEGFDMPRMKIAAYHRPHRSLPPTLQFIGRIARVTGGEAHAELVAVRDAFTRETRPLYQEDTAWSTLLPELVDAAVTQERVRRTYVSEADLTPTDISPTALTPRRITQVFDTASITDVDLHAQLYLIGFGHLVFRFVDADAVLMAVITERRVRPDWIESDVLDTNEYHLHLVVHHREQNLLYVTAPSETAVRQLREAIGAADTKQIPPERVARYLWSREVASYSSVGMRNARASAAAQATYRSLAGPAVEGAVSENDSRGYALGHVIGRHGTGDDLHGMGVSLKRAKIWETTACESLLEFREWCYELSAAIAEGQAAHATAPNLQLRLPSELETFPDLPIACFLDVRLLSGGVRVSVGGGEVDVTALEVVVTRPDPRALEVRLGLAEHVLWTGRLRANGSVHAEADELELRWAATRELMTMTEALTEFPPVVFFADGSSSEGVTLYVPPEQLAPIPPDSFDTWEWGPVDITNEERETEPGAPINIQAYTIQWARENLLEPILIVDHAAYELADVIAIEPEDERLRVHLFHCKPSGEANPGVRLSDLYDVLGQAMRSARWTHPMALMREIERRARARRSFEIVHDPAGDAAAKLAEWSEHGVGVRLTVWIVQPGISLQRVDRWREGQSLISAGREWCRDQNATLRLAVSA